MKLKKKLVLGTWNSNTVSLLSLSVAEIRRYWQQITHPKCDDILIIYSNIKFTMSLKFFAFLSLAILVSLTVALPYHKANFATTLGESGHFEGKPFYKYFNFTKAAINRCLKLSAKTNVQSEGGLRHWYPDETDALTHTFSIPNMIFWKPFFRVKDTGKGSVFRKTLSAIIAQTIVPKN